MLAHLGHSQNRSPTSLCRHHQHALPNAAIFASSPCCARAGRWGTGTASWQGWSCRTAALYRSSEREWRGARDEHLLPWPGELAAEYSSRMQPRSLRGCGTIGTASGHGTMGTATSVLPPSPLSCTPPTPPAGLCSSTQGGCRARSCLRRCICRWMVSWPGEPVPEPVPGCPPAESDQLETYCFPCIDSQCCPHHPLRPAMHTRHQTAATSSAKSRATCRRAGQGMGAWPAGGVAVCRQGGTSRTGAGAPAAYSCCHPQLCLLPPGLAGSAWSLRGRCTCGVGGDRAFRHELAIACQWLMTDALRDGLAALTGMPAAPPGMHAVPSPPRQLRGVAAQAGHDCSQPGCSDGSQGAMGR